MLGIFGKKGPKVKPSYKRGGYSKPKRLPGVANKWQPPVEEPPESASPAAAKAGDPES